MQPLRRVSHRLNRIKTFVLGSLLLAAMLSNGCFLNEKLDRYYGRVAPPQAQHFNWGDGGFPQTFDPPFAAAPPDTDLVRAIFEGLTDYDPQSVSPSKIALTKSVS